jgi:hypothetical protein
MAYPSRLFRCNITATTPGEQIVNTVWMRTDATAFAAGADAQLVADRVRDKWTQLITGGLPNTTPAAAGLFANTTQWTTVSAYAVNATGHSVAQAEAVFGATVKGSAANALPPQNALVVTLLTARPGRSGRGRMFLGGLSTAILGSNGRLPAAQSAEVAQQMGEFYKSLRDSPFQNDIIRPVVVSPTLTDSFKIERVQVGDVMDTMRSRRGKLVEARAAYDVDA